MAKYPITYSCGHSEEKQLLGPEKERQGKIRWLRTQPCMNCKRERDFQTALAFAQEQGLLPLLGTQTQVRWAETLRYKMLNDLELWINEVKAKRDKTIAAGRSAEEFDRDVEQIEQAKQYIRAQKTQATWWIQRKDLLPSHLIQEVILGTK